jgi:hypothetical protein
LREPPRTQANFRLESEDFELLDLIRARYQLSTRVAALRFVLRWWRARIAEDAAGGK